MHLAHRLLVAVHSPPCWSSPYLFVAIVVTVVVVAVVASLMVVVVLGWVWLRLVDRAWDRFLVCLWSRGLTRAKVVFVSVYRLTMCGQMAQRLNASCLFTCTGSIPGCAYFFWASRLQYN